MKSTFKTGIDCVLFDLDGTLVDTAADFRKVLDTLLEQEGRPPLVPDQVHQTVSDGARALVRLAFAVDDSEPDFERRLEQLLDLYFDQLNTTEAQPYPGIPELLELLEQNSIAWGVVTNKPEKYSRRLLQNLGLLERCGVLVCPEHVKNRKPDPEALLLACQQLDCSTERTVYIGDHLRDMQAAKNADLIAVAAAYGYLGIDISVADWPADFVVHSAGDIEGLLSILNFA